MVQDAYVWSVVLFVGLNYRLKEKFATLLIFKWHMKRKILSLSLLLLLYFVGNAQSIKISGNLLHWNGGNVTYLTNIALVDVSVKVGAGGSFAMTIPKLRKGFYLLQGVGYLYLEPGYSITVGSVKSGNYLFKGKGSLENNLMLQAKTLINAYFQEGENGFSFNVYNMEVNPFLFKMDSYKKEVALLLAQSASGNFKTIAKGEFDFYCRNLLCNYYLFYGIDSIKQENYYKLIDSTEKILPARMDSAMIAMRVKTLTGQQRMKLENLLYNDLNMNDSVLLVNSSEYRKNISGRIEYLLLKDYVWDLFAGKEQSLIKLQIIKANISNEYVYEYYAYTFTEDIIKSSKNIVLKDSIYHDFMAHEMNPLFRKRINTIYKNFIDFGENKRAPDFTYNNLRGEKISLMNFRGKYVYIDVWATWCEPCKRESTYLAEVADVYKKHNIQFISLSVDDPGDIDKWRKYVKEHHLRGIQLIADHAFDSKFIKNFNINSIPRFILIDPDGKILSPNAQRPSNPFLKKKLDSLLQLQYARENNEI